jgi:hypothetical protein
MRILSSATTPNHELEPTAMSPLLPSCVSDAVAQLRRWAAMHAMSVLDTIVKMTTASGRAYLTLLRARVFAVGLVGASARISPAQRSLSLLLSERATDTLFALLENASLPGQLYALFGLSVSGQAGVDALIADYRHRTDRVWAQTACLTSLQPISHVVARIEDGTYSRLLHSIRNEAQP